MRKGLLIGVGTLGGLGAVLAITPPQFTNAKLAGTGIAPTTSTQPSNTPAPVQTTSAAPAPTPTKKATKKATGTKSAEPKNNTKSSTASNQANSTATTPTPSQAQNPTPTPTKTQSTTATGVSGTFAGAVSQTRFGPVQVQITVKDGKITAATALQYPNGDFRSANISSQAIPYLVQETLQAQSANIQGVGGASYTSYGWYQSLQSALAKAGMK